MDLYVLIYKFLMARCIVLRFYDYVKIIIPLSIKIRLAVRQSLFVFSNNKMRILMVIVNVDNKGYLLSPFIGLNHDPQTCTAADYLCTVVAEFFA